MKEQVLELLRKYTKHDYVYLTPKCNASIYGAFEVTKTLNPNNVIYIPDQGGWITYRQFPRKLKMLAFEYKTDYGVVDLKKMPVSLKNANSIIYSNPAGYFAEQPIKKIYDYCKEHCLVILDASGSIGSEMCDGNFADITLGSFGKWKPISIGVGGFISFKTEDAFETFKRVYSKGEFTEEQKIGDLYNKLVDAKKTYKAYYSIVAKIKGELKNFEILHSKKKGVNVVVKFNTEDEKQQLMAYCEKNKYEYRFCPRYIRVNESAISIEVKRA